MSSLSGHLSYAIDHNTLPEEIGDVKLKDYQVFTAASFLNLKTFRRLLLYWDTGSGKTLETIYIMKNLEIVYPKWVVFLFIKASLHDDPWKNSMDKYLNKNPNIKIIIIHYDDPSSFVIFQKKITEIDLKINRILFVIDEAHNFITRSLPIMGKKRYASDIYELIKKLLTKTDNRLIMITATPMINDIKEFNLVCGLLRNNYNITNQHFYKNRLLVKDKLVNLLYGTTSYNKFNESLTLENHERSDYFPRKNIQYITTTMSSFQSNIYNEAAKYERKTNAKGFRIHRRMASTFTYQGLKVKGVQTYDQYQQSIKERLVSFIHNYNLVRFSNEFIEEFKNNDNFEIYLSNNSEESNTFRELRSFSCKYMEACRKILQSKGKCLIYETFVSFEGVGTFKIYLEIFGIKYIEFTKDSKNRDEQVSRFNKKDNLHGEKIKACIFSGAGTEGISFFGINDLILLDIPWSDSILRQIIGRGIRLYSHKDLPIEKQYINIFIVIAKTETGSSVDQEMLNILIRKNNQLSELYSVLKEVSIEEVFKNFKPEIFSLEYIFTKLENEYMEENDEIDIVESRLLVPVYFTYDKEIIEDGFLDKKNNFVYFKDKFIGEVNLINFDIIDKKIVYIIDKKKK